MPMQWEGEMLVSARQRSVLGFHLLLGKLDFSILGLVLR